MNVKNVRKPTRNIAVGLLAANLLLGQATGRGPIVETAKPIFLAVFVLVALPATMWLVSLKFHFIGALYRVLLGVVKKAVKIEALQVALFGWAAVIWAGALISNLWTIVGRRPTTWLAPLGALATPERALAYGGGFLGAVAVLGVIVFAGYAWKQKKDGRVDDNDVHGQTLEKLLAPSIEDVKHLLVEPGSTDEVTRPYLGDALVTVKRKPWMRGLGTAYKVVALYLTNAASGLGVFGAPGAGKGASTGANTTTKPGGELSAYGDGHGLGFLGPQVLCSNKVDIMDSIDWRAFVAGASLRERNGGVEPSADEVHSLVTIYDPTGRVAKSAKFAEYRKGWSPMSCVTDHGSAKRLAEGLLANELASTVSNAAYFAKAAVRIVTAMLLAAHRDGKPLTQVSEWADEIQQAGTKVPAAIAKILNVAGADAEDKRAYAAFTATYNRLLSGGNGGERSAVWGTVETGLAPFGEAAIAASTTASANPGGMVDTVNAVTLPYSTLFIIMPGDATKLASTRSVFTAFLEELMDTAVREAGKCPRSRLPLPVLVTLDEFESTRIMPNLPANLATYRAYNIRLQWITQTYGGLATAFNPVQMGAIAGNTAARLTYGGYGAGDSHLAEIVAEIGAKTVTRTTKSKSGGESEHAGESESQDRVAMVDIQRLTSEVRADQMILQTSGPTSGMSPSGDQLRPFLLRQRRAVCSDEELAHGWWVDPVLHARLIKGTAAGVADEDRPDDRKWMRAALRLSKPLRAFGARLRGRWA